MNITGKFDTRRSAELAVEHIVQETPKDVSIQPVGEANSAGTRAAGADAKTDHSPEEHRKLEGALEVTVRFQGDDSDKISAALKGVGAKELRTT